MGEKRQQFDQMKAKRPRAPNYTNEEKEILLKTVESYKNIMENKKTDAVSSNEKKEAWTKICENFNALTPNMVFRPVESLKKYYEHLKEELRKRVANTKKELYKTGGGPPIKNIVDGTDDLLLSIINDKSIYGLESTYDSDSLTNATNFNNEKTNHDDENTLEEITQNVSNDIEIIYESEEYEIASNRTENSFNRVPKSDWKKPELLKQPVNAILNNNIQRTSGIRITPKQVENKKTENCSSLKKFPMNRRRPRAVVALTSSKLGEKYNLLIDQKLELIECFKKEHELRMQSLELDVALKRKQLTLLSSKDSNEMLMESQIPF